MSDEVQIDPYEDTREKNSHYDQIIDRIRYKGPQGDSTARGPIELSLQPLHGRVESVTFTTLNGKKMFVVWLETKRQYENI